MPTFNLFGWQKPCYLLPDGYAGLLRQAQDFGIGLSPSASLGFMLDNRLNFDELMRTTEWHRYGTESGNPKCANCMVHSGYEASAVNDTFDSLRGFWAAVRATFSSSYKDEEALAMLNEPAHPVHAYNPLVQIQDAEATGSRA